MKTFTNKNVIQKVIITMLIVLSFNFIVPNYSHASPGGVLFGPIIDLMSGIGDIVLSALQYFMYDGGKISVGSAVGGVVNTAATIVNPYDSFLLQRGNDDFDDLLAKYEMDGDGKTADVTVDTSQFDKGWLGSLFGIAEKDYGVPIIKYTPEAIFGNQVPALDVNFINPKQWDTDAQNDHSVTQDLHETIANWYVALRNLALVILLSVLIYVGIRMVLASAASEKSKYKQMLMDWLVAVCILFFLHYIMSFILSVTEMITEGITDASTIVVELKDSDNGDKNIITNLTGLCRLQVQYSDLGARAIYLLFYIALVIYTVMFTWTYVKRAVTMAFLTIMAPLVAITYPIDKIGDGRAQAFGTWLKEFIFNALLQPFHLIIYTIFMGASSEIAVKNPIYAILFLAFIIPAEKLLRKMFGFEKSSTAGGFAAGVGGAAAFKAVSSLVSKGAGMAKNVKSNGGGNIRTKKPVEQGGPSITDAFGGGSTSGSRLSGNSPQAGTQTGTQTSLPAGNSGSNTSVPGSNPAQSSSTNTPAQQNSTGGQPDPGQPTPDGIGIGQWASDYWNNSNAKQYLDNGVNAFKNNKYVRKVGAGVQGVKNMASGAKQSIGNVASSAKQGIGNTASRIRTSAGNFASGVSGAIENKLPGMQQALKNSATRAQQNLKNSAKGFASKAAPIARGSLAVAGELGKRGLKMAGTATMAGVGGMVGLAAGITGDSLDDVLKYGAAGLALGGTGLPALGRGVATGASNFASDISNTFRTAAYGADETALMQQEKEWKASDANEAAMVQAYMDMNNGARPSRTEKAEIMDSGAAFYNSGITETKDIVKGVKLENEIKKNLTGDGMAEEEANNLARMQAIYVAKKASEYSKTDLRDDKKVASLQNDLSKQLVNNGMEQPLANQQAHQIVNMIKKHKGVATD